MELYLIRHGIAADRGNYTNDEERPLTDKGRQKTDKV
ncbi:MAG: phosphohistidine phosphatase SixA, partial [Symploca sp. SIO2D2]|nr:phosphohistidine phosphatase SixA [Symploca sp. SIO2D2]